jgi:hypothetical protein
MLPAQAVVAEMSAYFGQELEREPQQFGHALRVNLCLALEVLPMPLTKRYRAENEVALFLISAFGRKQSRLVWEKHRARVGFIAEYSLTAENHEAGIYKHFGRRKAP